ncbi:MAG TPA: alpha/beta hydrolase [Candidatus Nanoarchaeia archaeon]
MRRDRGYLQIQQTQIDGLKVSFIRQGKGPSLVIVPGLFQHLNGLRHLVNCLSEHFDVTLLATPGSEGSSLLPRYDRETVCWWFEETLEKLGIRRAIIVSVSIGAALALLALADSKKIQATAYVVHEPVVRVQDAQFWLRWLHQVDRFLWEKRAGFVSIGFLWVVRAAFAHVLRRGWAKALLKTPLCSLSDMAKLLHEGSIHRLARPVSEKVPTMVVAGERKSRLLLNYSSMKQVMESMKAQAQAILARARHFLRRPDQENFAAQIIQFAQQRGLLERKSENSQ